MNLLRALTTIFSMTMLSRITGLIRETLIAQAFGASGYTDAFYTAFRIPNLLRRLFAEGAFAQAFVPILAEYKSRQGMPATKQLADHVATVLTWALLATCLVGIVAAPAIVYVIATGFAADRDQFQASVDMTRIMFPYIGFMALVALSGGILNTWREFRIPAFTPVLLNLSLIAAALLLAPRLAQPIYALAIAVFVGGCLQLAIQVPALHAIGMLPRIGFSVAAAMRDPGVTRVLRKMGPAIFGVSAAQISLIINTNIASHLATGSISWLNYADRLMEFPTALLGVALGTILLPNLAKAHSESDSSEYSALLDWGLRLTFLLALPAGIGLVTLSVPLTASLLNYGKFDVLTVAMTAKALVAYGIGLIGLILVKILAPGFYAKQNIRTPVKIGVAILCATQAMNLVFVPWIAHAGLALSIGLGACLNAAVLFWSLKRHGIYSVQSGWPMFFLKLAGALCLMAGTALWSAGHFDWTGLHTHPLRRIASLTLVIGACAAIYFGALAAMGLRLSDFKRSAKL